MVSPRLLPSRFISGLVLPGDEASVNLYLLWWMHAPVRAALASVGVEVVEVRTWFALGARLARRRQGLDAAADRLLPRALLLAAIAFEAISMTYLLVQSRHLPSLLPGREAGSTRHQYGLAVAAFAIAIAFLLVMLDRVRRRRREANQVS